MVTGSPPFTLIIRHHVFMSIELRTNLTDPSANRTLHPPVWNEKSSLLFVQFMKHGPGLLAPSAVNPWVMYSFSRSAHPADVAIVPLTFFGPVWYLLGRPPT